MCIYTYICQRIIPPELAHFLPASITFSVTELQIASFQFLHIYQFIISPASVQSRISHRYQQIALYISPKTYISSPTSSTNFYPHSTGIFLMYPLQQRVKRRWQVPQCPLLLVLTCNAVSSFSLHKRQPEIQPGLICDLRGALIQFLGSF